MAAAIKHLLLFILSYQFPVYKVMGSGALSGKMLLVSIVENNKIDAYLGLVWLSKGWLCPARVRKGIRIGPRKVRTPRWS